MVRGSLAGLVLLLLGSCYYNPIPENVKGTLVCTYNGNRAFVGEIKINGEAITNGISTFNPNGSWDLCGGDGSIKCTVSTKTSTETGS